eukprot:GHVH01007289.1.p1 GENE.GHVH01007289.1~~GHVH01007289.1.p1  ORF type:complete len:413 (+),score=46.06 GHVH01007289.1:49-1287(+)
MRSRHVDINRHSYQGCMVSIAQTPLVNVNVKEQELNNILKDVDEKKVDQELKKFFAVPDLHKTTMPENSSDLPSKLESMKKVIRIRCIAYGIILVIVLVQIVSRFFPLFKSKLNSPFGAAPDEPHPESASPICAGLILEIGIFVGAFAMLISEMKALGTITERINDLDALIKTVKSGDNAIKEVKTAVDTSAAVLIHKTKELSFASKENSTLKEKLRLMGDEAIKMRKFGNNGKLNSSGDPEGTSRDANRNLLDKANKRIPPGHLDKNGNAKMEDFYENGLLVIDTNSIDKIRLARSPILPVKPTGPAPATAAAAADATDTTDTSYECLNPPHLSTIGFSYFAGNRESPAAAAVVRRTPLQRRKRRTGARRIGARRTGARRTGGTGAIGTGGTGAIGTGGIGKRCKRRRRKG